eukprot:6108162-Prorocentrum_lima.AAC.1
MTSSLVGSEMCIRDRDSPAAATPYPTAATPYPTPPPTPPIPGIDGYTAVSYTHLTLPTICSV